MRKVLKLILAFILAVSITFGTGMAMHAAATVPKASVTKTTIYVGYDKYTIKLENTASNTKVIYKSSNEKIAAVSNKGVITPVNKGNAKVTVQISQGDKSYTSVIAVNVENPYVAFAARLEALDVGQLFNFQGKAYGLKRTDFVYSTSDSKVAVIDSKTGVLKAVGSGTVTVKVKDLISSKESSCKITVYSGGNKGVPAIEEEDDEDPVARIARQGNYVYFGSYPQTEVKGKALTDKIIEADYNKDIAIVNGVEYKRITYNQVTNFENKEWKGYRYFKIEPIKWRILSSNNKELFLVAEQSLDCAVYNDIHGNKACTWEKSTVREWLNLGKGHFKGKEGFLSAAFTKAEQNAILKKTIKNSKNSSYGTQGGNDTQDKVFLLSIEEASNKSYGFSQDKNDKDMKRVAYNTDYAIVMGSSSDGKGAAWWTLRSPGADGTTSAIVYGGGRIEMKGMQNNDHSLGIRPAVRIDLRAVVEK